MADFCWRSLVANRILVAKLGFLLLFYKVWHIQVLGASAGLNIKQEASAPVGAELWHVYRSAFV